LTRSYGGFRKRNFNRSPRSPPHRTPSMLRLRSSSFLTARSLLPPGEDEPFALGRFLPSPSPDPRILRGLRRPRQGPFIRIRSHFFVPWTLRSEIRGRDDRSRKYLPDSLRCSVASFFSRWAYAAVFQDEKCTSLKTGTRNLVAKKLERARSRRPYI
jgi:hypothetical protein